MGKLRQFEITFDHPQGVYISGTDVTGSVLLLLDEPMKMTNLRLSLTGKGKVHWTKSSGSGKNRHTKHYRAEEYYFDSVMILFGGRTGEKVHPSGAHRYSFELTIPDASPSSFEGQYGYVRYVAKAVIDKPWKFDHEAKAAFTVIKGLDLNLESPTYSRPMEGQESREVTCCCCVSGMVHCKLRLNKTAFVPGEKMLIWAEVINNTNSQVDRTCVAIKQYIDFYGRHDGIFSEGELKPKQESEIVAEIDRPAIPAGETDIWDNVPLRIPALPPSRLDGCQIITIQYVVKFYVRAWDELKLASDIMIGTVPIREPQYPVVTAQPASLPPPGQPALFPSAPPDDLPPPSYEECVKGHRQIRDEGDSEYIRGTLTWAPSYPTYDWPPPGGATAYPLSETNSAEPSAPSTDAENRV